MRAQNDPFISLFELNGVFISSMYKLHKFATVESFLFQKAEAKRRTVSEDDTGAGIDMSTPT